MPRTVTWTDCLLSPMEREHILLPPRSSGGESYHLFSPADGGSPCAARMVDLSLISTFLFSILSIFLSSLMLLSLITFPCKSPICFQKRFFGFFFPWRDFLRIDCPQSNPYQSLLEQKRSRCLPLTSETEWSLWPLPEGASATHKTGAGSQ